MGLLAICLYCSTLFLNQRSSNGALLVADLASCQSASDWSSNHRYNITSTASLPLWGGYRPGIYFGMKTRSPVAMSTGILWVGSNRGRNDLRHDTNQDELTQFEWIKHDGKHFGQQTLVDESYKMELKTTFIVKEIPAISTLDSTDLETKFKEDLTWIQRINVKSLIKNDKRSERQKSLFFYVGFEGAEHDELEQSTFLTDIDYIEGAKLTATTDGSEETVPQLFTILGRSKTSGYFRLVLTTTTFTKVDADADERVTNGIHVSFVGLGSGDVTKSVNELKESHSSVQYIRDIDENTAFLRNGNLKNSIEDSSNFLAVQIKCNADFTFDAVLYENLPVDNLEELRRLAVSEMEKHVADFLSESKEGKKIEEDNSENTAANKAVKKEVVNSLNIDTWISHYETKFNEKFDLIYKLHLQINEKNESMFSLKDIEASKRALSSLLGGIGYFYGSPK